MGRVDRSPLIVPLMVVELLLRKVLGVDLLLLVSALVQYVDSLGKKSAWSIIKGASSIINDNEQVENGSKQENATVLKERE